MIHAVAWFIVSGLFSVAAYLLADILIPEDPFGADQ